MERGIIQTSPEELSLYVSDHWRYPTTRISRYVLRTDGFVSINAGYGGGTVTTRPIVFDGGELELNYSTSAAGSVRVEVQDAEGRQDPWIRPRRLPGDIRGRNRRPGRLGRGH